MKIRTGFVSNSSSSSFVIEPSVFTSVFNIAKFMIPHRGYESDEKVIKLLELSDRNPFTPVTFSSYNYDTYIGYNESKNHFIVKTCNNHDWDLDKFHSDEDEIWEYFDRPENRMFWDLDTDLMIVKPIINWDNYNPDINFCPKHFSDKVIILETGKIECPFCYREKFKIKTKKTEDILKEWI